MDKSTAHFETLKQILRHARNPDVLNDHPWTRSLIVQEARAGSPHLTEASPGQQLINAIVCLFPGLQPASPPKHGKRLDPRWGEFGLLAALYFTPFNHGKPFPTSLMDAWARIDTAILYFVYGKPVEALAEEQIGKYQLVGADLDYAAASTLSDWHKKGLQRFTEIILDRERFLSRTSTESSIILHPEQAAFPKESEPPAPAQVPSQKYPARISRRFWLAVALLVIIALGLVSLQAWKIYTSGRLVYQDVMRLQELGQGPIEIETLDLAVPVLKTLQGDLSAFKLEVRPLLWLSPYFDWVPGYGHDLASAPALIDLAEHLLNTATISYQAGKPLLSELNAQSSTLEPAGLTTMLVEAQPQLEEARRELDQGLAARESIQAERLSPRIHRLLVEQIDPMLKLADEGLSLATALPGILGAANEGPKTYLLLPQNEDELRPTGGFITSVGNLVLHKGQVIGLNFEAVDTEQEDWSKPYPTAPWQLREYMNSRVLILRDSNWFTDFPTTALWVEYLYAYKHSHSVDGIMAFDQHFLVMLLGQIGPLEVDGASYLITDQNVIEYMRQSKVRPSGEPVPEGWYRKEFIGKLASAILTRLTSGDHHDWRGMASVLSQALAERHLLLQFDDSAFAGLIAERGWDNAVRPGEGDFLMVTDTNIGFNKTNAVVDVSLSYDVDLNDTSAPVGTLFVTHKNNASQDVPCIHWNSGEITGEEEYPINRCYWNYLRIYKQQGVELLEASPHPIPSAWMIRGQSVGARVDKLDEELPNVQAFGTLLVVPGGKSLSTGFKFALPGVLLSAQDAPGQHIYHLKVHKQPGTLAIPITIRIHLPNHATLKSTPTGAIVQGKDLLIKMDLRTDIDLEVIFSLP
jgi:uncharacterized protein DUF4012